MIGLFGIVAFLLVALFFAFLACMARTTEAFLWGAALCSLGLGVAVQISGGGYYGLVMLGAFLVTDLVIYLYFRTQGMLPATAPKNPRVDRVFRVVFLWLALTAIGGGAFVVFQPGTALPGASAPGQALALLHEKIWAADWLLILIPTLAIVAFVAGGFFLVRKDNA
jgi:hypothetical protein